jgi:hypothetical protein
LNKKLAQTANKADKNVHNKYKIIVILNLFPIPLFALDKSEETNTKTKIGAIPLKALTNNSPGSPK